MVRIIPAIRRALLLAAVTAAAGGAQVIDISTGTNGSGGVLADGATDPLWQISVQGGPFANAVVIFPVGRCCGMDEVDETLAKWITAVSTAGSQQSGWGTGTGNTAILRRTFDLTGYDLSTVSMTGNWRFADYFDNLAHGLFINGVRFDGALGTLANWDDDHPFALGAASFVAGVNTVEVRGYSVNSQYDGLFLDATVTGRLLPGAVVPEPSSIALLATGVVVLLGAARRRRAG
jgi:hypothetical protein